MSRLFNTMIDCEACEDKSITLYYAKTYFEGIVSELYSCADLNANRLTVHLDDLCGLLDVKLPRSALQIRRGPEIEIDYALYYSSAYDFRDAMHVYRRDDWACQECENQAEQLHYARQYTQMIVTQFYSTGEIDLQMLEVCLDELAGFLRAKLPIDTIKIQRGAQPAYEYDLYSGESVSYRDDLLLRGA